MQESKKTILLVDDQKINREVLKLPLKEMYEILEAENGREALEILDRHEEICLILLDLVMPEVNGYQLLEELRKRQENSIPVIVMTSESMQDSEVRSLDLGAVDYIQKPANPKVLMSRVRNAIMRNESQLLEQLQFISTHDPLTGVYNRGKMFSETRKMLLRHPDVKFAFIRYDIDRFRLYNSAMGEEEGNRLLKFMAEKIHETTELFPYSTFGRVDADVFCICEPFDQKNLKKQIDIAANYRVQYRDDYVIDSTYGIYLVEDNEDKVENMFMKATMAAEQCKNQHGVNYAYYEPSMGARILQEKWVTKEMKIALEREQFKVYLQPKYDIKTDLPCGAEALVRWEHPEKGLISPGQFIPVFETNGFISNLDMYMWEKVCALLHKWKLEGRNLAPVSVNMSRISLYNPHVTEIIENLVNKYEIEPSLLNLEVTESAYMSNPELMKGTIEQLQQAGFVIMMDDFGSGYSSLNTLKEIEVDVLKIDMKFLPEHKNDVRSEKILSSIVRMAGWLEMSVIAEGVETVEQKEFLESIGCGYVQGYYYAKPMPVAQYEEMISDMLCIPDSKESGQREEKPDAIWSSSPQIDNILKSISLPVVILELTKENVEIVRANHEFIQVFDYTADVFATKHFLPGDEVRVKQTLEHACQWSTNTECEFQFVGKRGDSKWMRMKVQLLSKIEKSCMLCCTFVDISSEKKYENQLQNIMTLMNTKVEKRKMLIIDDLKFSRTLLYDIFSDQYEIVEAKNGKQGMTLLAKFCDEISIILLDMVMPEMGGEEFLIAKNQMREASEIPVIVISSEKGAETQLNMLKLGVNDYITKPFDSALVMQRVKNVIEYNSRFHRLITEYQNAVSDGES